MATKQLKKNQPKFEDFDPVSERQELPGKFIFVVNLPGFRKENFKVQVDNLGKLSVKGQKQIDDNTLKRFNKVFQLPPDSDVGKIRGKFEGEVLTLTVPKKPSKAPPPPSIQEVKKGTEEAEAKPKDEPKVKEKEEETKEEPKAKEKEEETKEEPKAKEKEKETKEEPKAKEKEEETKEEPKKTSEKIEEEIKPKEETDKKVTGEPKSNGETIEELAKEKEETSMPEIKEDASRINDAMNKWKESISAGENKEITLKGSEERKIVSWKERISKQTEAWSDYASFDNMLDTINRNKKVIVVAVAAFSIAFLVSRKLRAKK